MRWIQVIVVALSFVYTAPGVAHHKGKAPQESAVTVAPASPLVQPQPDSQPAASGVQTRPSSLLESLGIGKETGEFLNPDAAFVLSTEVTDANTVVARWTIADAYYLYRDKFKFALQGAEGIALGAPEIPAGKVKTDEFFGRVEVFYDQAQAVIPLQRTAADPTTITLDVGYQGCADAGLCYPPMKKTFTLALPVASDTGAWAPPGGDALAQQRTLFETAGALPEQDRIARSLAAGSTWIVLLSFFGFGLLLTFTPCVFPMIPILSSIIVGQGPELTTRKAFALSFVYVLAMAATYTIAGVIAGLFGANLQIVFQDPWVLSAFAVIFVLLALSMFGLYDLQIPAGWQARLASLSNRQQGGTYFGVAIMGFLSALIVGPCVAAPLAGALIYISQTGDAMLGGTALFALSMGMGAPVLAVGTSAGKLLPAVGPWMNVVKAVFGVLLLGVAIYLIERIVPESIAMLLWATLLIVVACYLGVADKLQPGASGWRRLWKGAGYVMMVYGVLLVAGAASGGGDVFQPLKGLTAYSRGELRFKPVKGADELRAELVAAAAREQAVMLDFYADWCVSCKELEKYTFSDAGVQKVLANTLVLQTDVTANDDRDQTILSAFGLFGPPAILFFGPDGKERPQYRIVGFMNAEKFRAHATRAISIKSQFQANYNDATARSLADAS